MSLETGVQSNFLLIHSPLEFFSPYNKLKKEKEKKKEKQFSILYGEKEIQEENVFVESYSGHLFPIT